MLLNAKSFTSIFFRFMHIFTWKNMTYAAKLQLHRGRNCYLLGAVWVELFGIWFYVADVGLLMCLIHLAQYRSNQVWHSEPLIGSNVRTCHLMCRAPRAILYSCHLRDEAIIFGVLTRRMDGKIYLCLTYRRRHCRGNPGLCLGTHRGTAANITFCPWYLSGDCFDFWSESAIIA